MKLATYENLAIFSYFTKENLRIALLVAKCFNLKFVNLVIPELRQKRHGSKFSLLLEIFFNDSWNSRWQESDMTYTQHLLKSKYLR